MRDIATSAIELGALDRFARQDSPVHSLDPRAKLLTTLVFVVMVVSFGKYDVSALLPFAAYPILLAGMAGLPPRALLKRIAMVAPFALLVAAFNPILDRQALVVVGAIPVSGGWVSFTSILLRFALTVGAALVLLGTTGIHGVCLALERLGAPRVFVVQLLFLHRYLFVLVDEGVRMIRARSIRTIGSHGHGLKPYSSLVGHMLLHSVARAQRIHVAMRCRGFDGRVRSIKRGGFTGMDAVFVMGWSTFFVIARVFNLPQQLGSLVIGAMQ